MTSIRVGHSGNLPLYLTESFRIHVGPRPSHDVESVQVCVNRILQAQEVRNDVGWPAPIGSGIRIDCRGNGRISIALLGEAASRQRGDQWKDGLELIESTVK